MGLVKKIINHIENHKAPFINFIGSFLVLVLLRNFIEMYATGQDNDLVQALTYSPFYLALCMWFIWYFSFFTGEPVLKSAKVVLFFFVFILIPPVVDVIFSSPGQVRMRYLSITGTNSFIVNLLTVGMADEGISWGQRVEIITASICGYFYFYTKINSVFRSVILAYGIYLWIFLFGTFGQLINILFRKLNVMYVEDSWMLAKFYFIIGIVAFIVILWTKNKKLFLEIIKDSRPLRLIHFYVLLAFGFTLYYINQPSDSLPVFYLSSENVFLFVLIPIAIYSGALFSIVDNNIRDLEIDRISNVNRPLVKESLTYQSYVLIGRVSLAISLIAAFLASKTVFVIMALIIGLYFLYSSPPFRLKKILFLGKFIVGINSFLMCLMGYCAFEASAMTFPLSIALFLLIPLSLAGNFIDLKDLEGDRKAGIMTLPVLIGFRKSQWIIALFTICSYSSAAYLLGEKVLAPVFLVGFLVLLLLHLYYLLKKQYNELPVFIIYLISIISFIIIYTVF